jgi:hypothetical protein
MKHYIALERNKDHLYIVVYNDLQDRLFSEKSKAEKVFMACYHLTKLGRREYKHIFAFILNPECKKQITYDGSNSMYGSEIEIETRFLW